MTGMSPWFLALPLRGRFYAALQTLRGRPVGRFVDRLHAGERLPPAEFWRRHDARLRAMLEYARTHVPLYRSGAWEKALSHGCTELSAWPVLEHDTLREHSAELRARPQPGRVVFRRTSGSTSEPARVPFTLHADTWGWAHRYRGLLWHGIPIGVPALRLSQDKRFLRDRVLGQHCEPSLDTPQAIDRAVRLVLDERLPLVSGPPSALFYLARCMRERGVFSPPALFARVGGEQLFPFQRTAIEQHLGARAIDSYGCTEVGALAGECPAGSMHVYAEHVHLEIFNGHSPAAHGQPGDIVLTGLHNRAMPLIRYRVGDRARLSTHPCACGLPHPVLLDLQARSSDTFPAADGTQRHGAELAARLGDFFATPAADGARQVQFTQVDPLTWRVRVEVADVASTSPAAVQEPLAAIVRQVFGEVCRVETELGPIPRTRGKLRYYRAQ